MVQLVVGWGSSTPQPIANPLVMHSLKRALANRNISIFMSPAPGGINRRTAGHCQNYCAKPVAQLQLVLRMLCPKMIASCRC
jgi:hypothetical protein